MPNHRSTQRLISFMAAVILLLIAGTSSAQKTTDKSREPAPEPEQSVTSHQVRIAGQTINYQATAGWLIQKKNNKPVARFGYTAYTREGVENPAERPIMFAFNGGPGSSSIWLHMGILGPERVVITDEGFTPPPGNRVDNAFSIIDVADLVMVDPVGTGFSKPLGKAKGDQFWGVDQDIRSVGDFIKQYITESGRWLSPKFILGESYGGIRGAGLAQYLQSTQGMHLNGLILVSPFFSAISGFDGADIDLPHVLYLPTFAATAWYHDQLTDKPDDLQAFLSEVEQFARSDYAAALMQGFTIPAERKQAIANQLAAYTGTSADYWEKADLRVSHQQFVQELLRDQRQIAGRIDSRFIGPAVNPLSESMDYDPFFPSVGPAFTAAFKDYLYSELEFRPDAEYQVSAFGIDWDWAHTPPGDIGELPFPNLLPDLSMALTTNPNLQLLIQHGYYDLATPFGAMHYDIDHLDIPAAARERVEIAYYESGHMMYLHEPSMRQYRDDLVAFIRKSLAN